MHDYRCIEGILYAYPMIKKSIDIDSKTLKMLDDYESLIYKQLNMKVLRLIKATYQIRHKRST